MHNLIRVIGLAPSELTQEALFERIKKERARVMRNFEAYFNRPAQKKALPKVKKKTVAGLGMSEEEFLAELKELRAKKGGSK